MTTAHRLSVPEIKALLQDRVGELAPALVPEGKRQGRYWLARSPLRDEKNESFAIWLTGAGRGAWKDFGSGDKGDIIDLIAVFACGGGCPPSIDARKGAIHWAKTWLGLDRGGVDASSLRRAFKRVAAQTQRRDEDERGQKQKKAFEIWLAGDGLRDTVADVYLRARGIDLRAIPNLEASLRFCARIKHPHCDHVGPAMLGKFVGPIGDFRACHVTFLAQDGAGKAALERPKIIYGSFTGAVIRLTRGESGLSPEEAPPGPCVVGEGIETVLTAALARPDWRAWAAGTLDNMGNVPKHRCVDAWIVAADNDLKPTARESFERALAKISALGLPVVVARAFGEKNDLNDLLMGECDEY